MPRLFGRCRIGRQVLVSLLFVALAGCGSTVQQLGASNSAGAGSNGLSVGPGTPGTASSGVAAGSGGVLGGAGGSVPGTAISRGQPGAPVAAGPGGANASLPPAPPPGTSGWGFTSTLIRIGVAYDSTYSQEAGSAGVSSGSATVGDQKQQVNALVADINSRGGIDGRKVVPIFYDTNGINSQNNPATLAQAACSAWTQDAPVFAAMTFVVQMDNPTLYNCLAQHHVIFVPLGGDTAATMARFFPYLWSPSGMPPERLVPVWIDRLVARGYFGGWNTTLGSAGTAPVKIGLLYGSGLRNGEPSLDTVFVNAVKHALAAHGLHVTDAEQISNSQADEASAVLKFKSDNVTHVIGDYSVVNFTTSAESQQYRPRYGITSVGGGVALDLFATKDQLNGALGVGWIPAADVEAPQDPGDVSPAETRCRQIMANAQQPTSTRLAWFAETQACETFDFLATMIARSGLSEPAFAAAAASAGRLPPVSTFEIEFPGERPDGAEVVRDVGYVSSCSCFEYLSSTDYAA